MTDPTETFRRAAISVINSGIESNAELWSGLHEPIAIRRGSRSLRVYNLKISGRVRVPPHL